MYTDTELEVEKAKAETAFNLMMELSAHQNLIKADEGDDDWKPTGLFPKDYDLEPFAYIYGEDGETVTGVKFSYWNKDQGVDAAGLVALPDGKRIIRFYRDNGGEDELVKESEPCEVDELSQTWWGLTGTPSHITPLMQTGVIPQNYYDLDGAEIYHTTPADSPFTPVPKDTEELDAQGKAQLEAFLETANAVAPNVAAIQYCLNADLLAALLPDDEIDGGIFVTYHDELEARYIAGVVGSDAARILKLKNGMHRIELLKNGEVVKQSEEVSPEDLAEEWNILVDGFGLDPVPMDDSPYFIHPNLMAMSMD